MPTMASQHPPLSDSTFFKKGPFLLASFIDEVSTDTSSLVFLTYGHKIPGERVSVLSVCELGWGTALSFFLHPVLYLVPSQVGDWLHCLH